MKILIDPRMAVLVQGMTDAQCAELLHCIFEYPNRDCEMGLWKYIRAQIEEDEKKYKAKCERMAENRQKRTLISKQISSAEVVVDKNINKNNVIKCSESSNAKKIVENSVEKPMDFHIDENFSFQAICELKPVFKEYLSCFPMSVIARAEETFKRKRQGQWVSMQQLLEWIEKENVFYNQKTLGTPV